MSFSALICFLVLTGVAVYAQTPTGFAFGLITMGGVSLTGVLPLSDAAIIVRGLSGYRFLPVNGAVRPWSGISIFNALQRRGTRRNSSNAPILAQRDKPDPALDGTKGCKLMPISRANGLDIYFETTGCGPAMVFVHPLPFDHNVWLYQQATFSADFRVFSMDLRGWGASAKPTGPFTLEDMGQDIMALLSEAGVANDAVIVGCSIGSKIALMLACDHPEMFRAAILIGGNSGPQHQFEHRIAGYRDYAARRELRSYHFGHLRYGVTTDWANSALGNYLISGFADRGANLNADSIARVFEAMTVADVTPKLGNYITPTLVMNGEHDNALSAGTKTASLIINCEHFILRGAGHCCFIEAPEAFDARVAAFLRKHKLMPDNAPS